MKKPLFAVLAFTAFATSALAGRVEPGLWESTITQDDPRAAAARQHMSPAAREHLKAQGLEFTDAGMKSKICITKAVADHDNVGLNSLMKNCKVLKSSVVGNTHTADTECTTMGIVSHSHSEVTYENPHHYFGKISSHRVINGQPHDSSMTVDARFLAVDCGTVKPILR